MLKEKAGQEEQKDAQDDGSTLGASFRVGSYLSEYDPVQLKIGDTA